MELVNEIVEARNFWEAWMSVRRNKGAAGIDKMSVDVLDVYMPQHMDKIKQSICRKQYKPSPEAPPHPSNIAPQEHRHRDGRFHRNLRTNDGQTRRLTPKETKKHGGIPLFNVTKRTFPLTICHNFMHIVGRLYAFATGSGTCDLHVLTTEEKQV